MTGPSLWGRQSPPGALALPSPHPLAVTRSSRQGVLRPELAPVGGTRGVRHRGPRRRDLQGAVAAAARARPRRARRRDLGRRALRGPRSRGLVNGPQRRLRPESRRGGAQHPLTSPMSDVGYALTTASSGTQPGLRGREGTEESSPLDAVPEMSAGCGRDDSGLPAAVSRRTWSGGRPSSGPGPRASAGSTGNGVVTA